MKLLDPQPGQAILDLAVGHGAFINAIAGHHPELEYTTYGCDVDADALTVARYLYPSARLAHEDLAGYHPGTLVSMFVGNPPFALTLHHGGKNWRSELLFLHRAAELLKPGGLLAIVTPKNFLLGTTPSRHRQAQQRQLEPLIHVTLEEELLRNHRKRRSNARIRPFTPTLGYNSSASQ